MQEELEKKTIEDIITKKKKNKPKNLFFMVALLYQKRLYNTMREI